MPTLDLPAAPPDPLTCALVRLKVRPALNAPWLPPQEGYRAPCPLCKPQVGQRHIDVLGPWNGKLVLRPRCGHSLDEILRAAGLEPHDLADDGPGGDPLPELVPRLPNRADQWTEEAERAARLSQFLRQLPTQVADWGLGLLARAAETLLGPLGRSPEETLRDL